MKSKPFKAVMQQEHAGSRFICYCETEGTQQLASLAANSQEITILVGPEGDFHRKRYNGLKKPVSNRYRWAITACVPKPLQFAACALLAKEWNNHVKRINIYLLLSVFLFMGAALAPGSVKIARLKYSGGGDWYANRTSLPNLIRYCNRNINTSLDAEEAVIAPGSSDIYNYPFIHMTGHGNFVLTDAEAENLRKYLLGGGFLHIDDNYGLNPFVRPQMKKVFPELDFVELPFSHPVYHQRYQFNTGLPKVHEHEGKPPQGFGLIYEGRLVCFYTYECDLGNGWEDAGIYNDSPQIREKALQMGANLIQYVFTH